MTTALQLAADPAVIEAAPYPGQRIIQLCQEARDALRQALELGDMEQIAAVRTAAEIMKTCATQQKLGKEAQLSAAEIVRRAERALATAVRAGQRAGELREAAGPGPGRGKTGTSGTTFSTSDYLGTGHTRAEIYAMTDGVTDGEFEDVLDQAKSEGNLSRANVARKARHRQQARAAGDLGDIPGPGDRSPQAAARRAELISRLAREGSTSRQMAALLGIRDDAVRRIARERGIAIRADQAVGRTRRLDSNRIVRETSHALEALAMGAQLVDLAELDTAQLPDLVTSMTASLRELAQFVNTMKENVNDEQ